MGIVKKIQDHLFWKELDEMFNHKQVEVKSKNEYPNINVVLGQEIKHKRFGLGKVVEVISNEKSKVQFKDCEKVLLNRFAGF